MTRRRSSLVVRSVAAAVALTIMALGGGVPMCVSLIAHATAPCDMHTSHHADGMHSHGTPRDTAVAQQPEQTCHQDAGPLGCAAAPSCPTTGLATTALGTVPVPLHGASRATQVGSISSFASHSATPLSPPPQA